MQKIISLAALSAVVFVGCANGGESDNQDPAIEFNADDFQINFDMETVALMNDAEGCLSVIDGKVYDFTDWIDKHPGGAAGVLSICGKDGSEAFAGQHGGQQGPEMKLDDFYVGDLE